MKKFFSLALVVILVASMLSAFAPAPQVVAQVDATRGGGCGPDAHKECHTEWTRVCVPFIGCFEIPKQVCECVPDEVEPPVVIPVTGKPGWEWPDKPFVPQCTTKECAEFTWEEAIAPAPGTMNVIWTSSEVPNFVWDYGLKGWFFDFLPVSRAYLVSPEKFEIIYAGNVIEAAPSDKVGGLYLLSAPPSGDWRITKGLTAGVFDEYSWTEDMRFRNVEEGATAFVVNHLLSCRGAVLD